MRFKQPEILTLDHLKTPIGIALLAVDSDGYLRAFDWADYGDRQLRLLRRFGGNITLERGSAPDHTLKAITDYFDGDLEALGRVPWRSGGSEFQQSCWKALCAIPAGSVATYGMQAIQVGRPTAFRAVGLANGCNPVGVVVPCHRVIGTNRSLTGYGGGLWRKRWLLRHEGVPEFQDRELPFDISAELERALAAA